MGKETKQGFLLQSPLLLQTKEGIAEKFGVSQDTVALWAREGAPIFLVGKKYQADYRDLIEWLKHCRPVVKKFVNPPLPSPYLPCSHLGEQNA